MKFISRAFFVLFVLVGVLIAVSNAQRVELSLWPLPHVVVAPLYLVVVALLLLGSLAGFGLGWWASRHARRRARDASREADRLAREVVQLKESLAAMRPAPVHAGSDIGGVRPREQKAIERQSALVAPELLPPSRSRPS